MTKRVYVVPRWPNISMLCGSLLVVFIGSSGGAQQTSPENPKSKLVEFTTQQDHQNMLQQLGITKLRPGPSGDPNSPNAANTDESKANVFTHLPELMRTKAGLPVTTKLSRP
jgi:hypothetical protein